MASKRTKSRWNDIKQHIAEFDRAGLLALVQDLYAASKDNQNFLHTRFGLIEDALAPYKAAIACWLGPGLNSRQAISVAKASKAIIDYRRASGRLEGLAELQVFYCEQALSFLSMVGLEDNTYFDALARTYRQAAATIRQLPEAAQTPFWARLIKLYETALAELYSDLAFDFSDTLDIYGARETPEDMGDPE